MAVLVAVADLAVDVGEAAAPATVVPATTARIEAAVVNIRASRPVRGCMGTAWLLPGHPCAFHRCPVTAVLPAGLDVSLRDIGDTHAACS
jgi:hypothetical protein